MFTYKLSYVDIGYQDRKIFSLTRVINENSSIQCIRASSKTTNHGLFHHKTLNFSITDNQAVLGEKLSDHSSWCESILKSKDLDQTQTRLIELWTAIIGLANYQSFLGHPLSNEVLEELEITDLKPEQKQLIDSIFDTAIQILPQTPPVLLPRMIEKLK